MTLVTENELNKILNKQSSKDTLRFMTCGSVDDGKSTLIGRMLFDANTLFDDQINDLKQKNKIIDFSSLVDGLQAEREQGITIDVAYRYFFTNHRKFIVADAPGHFQYTRNMATAASTSDLAIILADATKGILPQTKRHTMICAMMGIKNIILAINKMDLVNYEKETYKKIQEDYEDFAKVFKFEMIYSIPIVATTGENIVSKSKNLSWYSKNTIFNLLENIDTKKGKTESFFRMPVQWINRNNSYYRGITGKIVSGKLTVNDKVKVLPSNILTSIKSINSITKSDEHSVTGESVSIELNQDLDVSRGDIIVSSNDNIKISDHFRARIIWFHENPGYIGRSYKLKIYSKILNAQITSIKHEIDVNKNVNLSANNITINNIYQINIKIDQKIPFTCFEENKSLGSFILIDRNENNTVAAGIIHSELYRANNIFEETFEVDIIKRNDLNSHKSKVIWFTGLSGAGKSTIANLFEKKLYSMGIRTYVLDGDNLRKGINKDLGFTKADRIENIRRTSEIAKLMMDSGIVVLVALISPLKSEREMTKKLFKKDQFFEVFVDAPIEILKKRDVKGLYKKAQKGEIKNFTGISQIYEEPDNPDFHLKTNEHNAEYLVNQLLNGIDLYK